MTHHTAGPWRFDPERHAIFSTQGEPEVMIADLNQWETDRKEYEANAHLIAATPDLYLAAVAALSLLSGSIEEEARHFVTEDLIRACLRAEGKVPE